MSSENSDVAVRHLDEAGKVDLLVYAVGYESRSLHVVSGGEVDFGRALGIRFRRNEIYAFEANLAWAVAQADVRLESAESDLQMFALLSTELQESFPPGSSPRIAVDISSFPRSYIASILSALEAHSDMFSSLEVEFYYAVATYAEPETENGPIIGIGSVRSEFSGLSDGAQGLAAIIGLGYEPHLALAAQQVLDPTETWLAIPSSEDTRFDRAVRQSNTLLMEIVPTTNQWSYPVYDPVKAFQELEVASEGLIRERNLILTPLGPKIFTLVALLVSVVHGHAIGVWRLKAGGLRPLRDQVAAGPVYGMLVSFAGVSRTSAAPASASPRS